VAAVSVGVVGGEPVLDLDYPEDSTAETDMNVVMTGDGRFVEVQGTAEGEPFDRDLLDACSTWPPKAARISPPPSRPPSPPTLAAAADGTRRYAVTRRIVLATRNAHKVGELREILADVLAELDLDLVGLVGVPRRAPTSSRTG
jgi:hypothetical protein